MSLYSNHHPVTQDNPQTLLWAGSCRIFFLTTELHSPRVSSHRRKHLSTHGREDINDFLSSPEEERWVMKPVVVVAKHRHLKHCGPRETEISAYIYPLSSFIIIWSTWSNTFGESRLATQLSPKLCNLNQQSRWINSSIGKRKNMYRYFLFPAPFKVPIFK